MLAGLQDVDENVFNKIEGYRNKVKGRLKARASVIRILIKAFTHPMIKSKS